MTAAQQIDEHIKELGDWRGVAISEFRKIVLASDPSIVEEWKWSTPVWSSDGLICAAGAFKSHVKLNFFRGASLPDPLGVLNDSLEAKLSRSIRLEEGNVINAPAITGLVKASIEHLS